MDLGSDFRAKLAHLDAKLAIKALLEAPLGALEAPLGALGRHLGSKMLPRRSPQAPRPHQTSILSDFQIIFGRDLMKISSFSSSSKASRAKLQRAKSGTVAAVRALAHWIVYPPPTGSRRV